MNPARRRSGMSKAILAMRSRSTRSQPSAASPVSTWCGPLPRRRACLSCVMCAPAVSPRRRGRLRGARPTSLLWRWKRTTAPRGIHPRVPRPFRRHAGTGARRNVLRQAQATGADHDEFDPHHQPATAALCDRQGPAHCRHRRALRSLRQRRRGIPNQWQQFHQKVADIPDRVGAVAYGVCCNGDNSGNFDYIAGVEVADFSDLPREFARMRFPSSATSCSATPSTSRPFAGPSARSGIGRYRSPG